MSGYPAEVGIGALSESDPFDTAALRRAVLQAWSTSPTRFREDANAEEDLRLGGYRDRLFVELAQNAADAAGGRGVLQVRLVDGELRIANTGAPLSAAGVASLASLRASAKRDAPTVGRFGVGFAAVLAVSDEPSIVSASGGVGFSAAKTREAVTALPGPAEELAAREGEVPVLRLVWPVPGAVPEGFDTEVRLPLRPDVDGAALLAAFAEQAADLLLALPALTEIRLGDRSWRRVDLEHDRVEVRGPDRVDRWLLHRASGQLAEGLRSDLGAEARHRAEWWVCWAVPLDAQDEPLPLGHDVLHVPTPTAERLSLPARLLASVPVESDRRRVSASGATEQVLVFAAECYPELVVKLPSAHRPMLVPLPAFPLSDVDDKLRQAVLDRLRFAAWLPTVDGHTVAVHSARVLDPVSPELTELLRDVVPGLLVAELSDVRYRKPLSALEVRRLGLSELVEAVTGLRRPASWWWQLYDALAPLERADPQAREDLSALPVPLADGRTSIGVRDVLLAEGDADPVGTLSTLDITGLRIVHPEASHPLLERLGAHRAGPAELLDSPALEEAVGRGVTDARAGMNPVPLADAVLRLVELAGTRDWLPALALPSCDGDFRRADELLLPDAALLEVLAPDVLGGELATLDEEFAGRWPDGLLRSIGVADAFVVVEEEEPAAPDPRFADSEHWWHEWEAANGRPPSRLLGVRDLDLVAEDAWPAALRLLMSDPAGARALREPQGYAAWWITRYASLAGHPPRHWRLPEAEGLAGLYDPIPDVGLDAELLRLIGVRGELRVPDDADAADLIKRLGDPKRAVHPGMAMRAHRVLADAAAAGLVDAAAMEPPEMVRTLTGAVASSERAAVLDEPWLLDAMEAALLVSGGAPDEFDADALVELLDLPLASEDGPFEVHGAGQAQPWSEVAGVVSACELLGVPVPQGSVTLHDGLRVRTRADESRVHWWVDATGGAHSERNPDALSRALAWTADRWHERFAFAALLAHPDARTLLR